MMKQKVFKNKKVRLINLICIKHSDYIGDDTPMLTCPCCRDIFVKIMKQKIDAKNISCVG